MGKVRGELALGLISGFGTVALHGREGFRAELALIACMFSNRVRTGFVPAHEVRVQVPHRRQLRGRLPGRRDQLQAAADKYGVPCLPIESALSIGFLQELGMDRYAVQNVRNWLEDMRHGPPPKDKPRPPTLRLRPA